MYFENVWLAFVALLHDIGKLNLLRALIGLDRLGNSITGGHWEFTVSARIGWFSMTKHSRYWRFLEKVVNTTFTPLEGPNHCINAYTWEKEHKRQSTSVNYRRGNDLALSSLSIITIVACMILAPLIWLVSKLK